MSINAHTQKSTEKDFLGSGSQVANTDTQCQENREEKKAVKLVSEEESEYIRDSNTLSMTALKDKYSSEYNTHKNMKSRCKNGQGVLASEFESFRDFLRVVGPRIHNNYTLDRLDNDNPEYGVNRHAIMTHFWG